REASSAAAAVWTDSSRTLASAALQHFEVEACKRGHYLTVRYDRAVDDRIVEIFVMHESVERPALRQRQRVAQLDKRTERRAGSIQIWHAVVVVDRCGALPGQARIEHQRLLRLDERPRRRGAHFVALVTSGHFVQRAHLADEIVVAIQPFRSGEIGGVARA